MFVIKTETVPTNNFNLLYSKKARFHQIDHGKWLVWHQTKKLGMIT